MKIKKINKREGFTLIELLITIAIVGIISVVAFVALNPTVRFQDSRDAVRFTDVTAVLDAAKVDQVDNGGGYVAAIAALDTGIRFMIGTGGPGNCDSAAAVQCYDYNVTSTNCVDLAGLVTEGYIASVPIGPSNTTTYLASTTGYVLTRGGSGGLTIEACDSENTASISVAR